MIDIRKKVTRIVACFTMILIFANVITPIVAARASNFISATSANISAGNNGNVTVSFSITGTGTMTEIGATRIELRENGTLVATYLPASTSGMMGSKKALHSGTVTYKGVAGRTYRATVSLRASNSNGADSRVIQTASIIAR